MNASAETGRDDRACAVCSCDLGGLSVAAACPRCGAPVARAVRGAVRLDGQAVVRTDRACVQCSYNLRGLPVEGRCPECGRAVADSLRGILLQFASGEYLSKVNSGLSLLLTGILLTIVVGVLSFAGAIAGRQAGYAAEISVITSAMSLGVSVMILVGYLRYSAPDPGFVGTERPDAARRVLRVAVIVQTSIALVQTLWQLNVLSGLPLDPTTVVAIAGLLTLAWLAAWVTQFFALMNYTGWMARRVPDTFIEKRSRTYRWLLPLIAVVGAIALYLGPLIALVLYWNLLNRLRKHTRSIIAIGEPAKLKHMTAA